MKKTDVLLIKPFYYNSHYGNRFLLTGLGYVSEALRKSDINSRIVDMGLGCDLDEIRRKIEVSKTQMIGISMMSFGSIHTYKMIENLKKAFPHIPIVVGGPHVSTMRKKVLRECRSIDYGITLEGEETIVDLCQGDKPLSEIKGLLFRDTSGNVVYTGDREFIADLDSNGFPMYSGFDLDQYSPVMDIVTSRGCPSNCIYCPVASTIGKKYRMRSAKSVVDEICYWYNKGYREFGMADDNFSLNRERVFNICDEIEKQGMSGLKLRCGNGLRADRVDRALLARMKDVGFYYIAFGVEGGNNKVLASLQKGEKIEAIEEAIKHACNLGYLVVLFFLLGSPGETKEDVKDSVKLALKYPVYDARFYNLIPFPNTILYEWVCKYNYFIKDPDKFISKASHWVNDPIFETPELPYSKRKKLYKWANNRVKWHTWKEKKKCHFDSTVQKFRNKGFPKNISRLGAHIYWNKCFRKISMVDKFRALLENC